MIGALKGPAVDWTAMAPFTILACSAVIVLLAGTIGPKRLRGVTVPVLTLLGLAATLVALVRNWGEDLETISGAVRVDDLTTGLGLICVAAATLVVLLGLRPGTDLTVGRGEYHSLMLFTLLGMVLLISSGDLVTLFASLELLSIPLYVLCASEIRARRSLEAGVKYLIVGSVGSATLLYGLAMIYGATGTTSFEAMASAVSSRSLITEPLMLAGIAFATAGIAFKASAAPFHGWTPDVYEGAPTPVTAFMATATKVAALAILVRLFVGPLASGWETWAPVLAALSTLSIVVGNFGALGQVSLKRMLAWSSIAQAGYLIAGIVVATALGVQAVVFYLVAYALITLAALAVVIDVQRGTDGDDSLDSFSGLGRSRPVLAGAMTIAMLSLAGLPPTGGFIGKVSLIDADIAGGYTWLAIVIVLGSLVSLGYYLRVIAVMWMRGADGARDRVGARRAPEIAVIAVVAAIAGLGIGIAPNWTLDHAARMGQQVAKR